MTMMTKNTSPRARCFLQCVIKELSCKRQSSVLSGILYRESCYMSVLSESQSGIAILTIDVALLGWAIEGICSIAT